MREIRRMKARIERERIPPSDDPNLDAFTGLLASQGLSRDDALRRLRSINGYAPAFRKAGDAIADKEYQ